MTRELRLEDAPTGRGQPSQPQEQIARRLVRYGRSIDNLPSPHPLLWYVSNHPTSRRSRHLRPRVDRRCLFRQSC